MKKSFNSEDFSIVLCKSFFFDNHFSDAGVEIQALSKNNQDVIGFSGICGEVCAVKKTLDGKKSFIYASIMPLKGECSINKNYVRLSIDNDFCEEYWLVRKKQKAYIINTLCECRSIHHLSLGVHAENYLLGLRIASVNSDSVNDNLFNILCRQPVEERAMVNELEWKELDASELRLSSSIDLDNSNTLFEYSSHLVR